VRTVFNDVVLLAAVHAKVVLAAVVLLLLREALVLGTASTRLVGGGRSGGRRRGGEVALGSGRAVRRTANLGRRSGSFGPVAVDVPLATEAVDADGILDELL
jgi:hypothetical protein